jgi:hypothetical protein
MRRLIKSKKVLTLIILIYIFVMGQIAQAFAGEPGSSSDPLVTKSFVEKEIGELKTELEELISNISSNNNSGSVNNPTPTPSGNGSNDSNNDDIMSEIELLKTRISELESSIADMSDDILKLEALKTDSFQVVEVPESTKLYLGGGTELIVRAGTCEAITGEMGGLANLTDGNDLNTGDAVPLNHHLLSSRDDGRGIEAITKLWVLIKGEYRIKQ